MRNRIFLGQVPLRTSAFGSLGQTVNRYIPDPNAPAPFQPFTPGQTPEEYERKEATLPKLAQQQAQCAAIQQNMLDAHARWKDFEYGAEGEEAAYNEYHKAASEYDKCVDTIDALVHYMDFGGTVPWNTEVTYEWPKEVPEPESYQFEPAPVSQPLPPPVASVHEVQNTTTEPISVQEPAQPPPQPPPVASTDWRFAGCPPGTQRLVRGGACINPGLVSGALTAPSTQMTTPMAVNSAVLRGRSIPARPLYNGRF